MADVFFIFFAMNCIGIIAGLIYFIYLLVSMAIEQSRE